MKHGTEFDSPDEVTEEDLPEGVTLRDHTVDGIREYDQRLPKWWLAILFGVIGFSVIYWFVIDDRSYQGQQDMRLEARLADIETARLAGSIDVKDNESFWEMKDNEEFVNSGQTTFDSLCSACHGKDLEGGIGFNLVDDEWAHGSQPADIYATIADGVPDSGMQAWESQLGRKRIAEVVAYILSKNPNLEPADG
ncbi:MAG: c-type cytochrome [Opitutales bacterium]